MCVIQLYFGRGEIHLYCVSWIWHSYPDSSASIYFIAPTKITPGAWRDPASCVGYVVFSPLFSCLSKPGTVQIRQFPLTYQIFNFVTRIKNPHLRISPKSVLWRDGGWDVGYQQHSAVTRIICIMYGVLALCPHHWQWHKLKTSSMKTRPRFHSLME